jgi:hypothetical protein
MILNVGGGPTPDKPTVTLSVPDPNHINSLMNLRVADIQACYKLWKSRGAEFMLGALSPRLATGRTMELVNDLTIVAARVLIATDSFLAGRQNK